MEGIHFSFGSFLGNSSNQNDNIHDPPTSKDAYNIKGSIVYENVIGKFKTSKKSNYSANDFKD